MDIVTDVDLQSEQEVCATLLSAFPTHSILGEEGGARAGSDARYRWIVDPLDGTTNYAHGFPFFCVSIGFEVEGQLTLGVAYAPSLDELSRRPADSRVLAGSPLPTPTRSPGPWMLPTWRTMASGAPYVVCGASDAWRRPTLAEQTARLASDPLRIRAADHHRLADLEDVGRHRMHLGAADGTDESGDVLVAREFAERQHRTGVGGLVVLEAGGTVTATDGSAFSVDGGQVLATNGQLHQALTATLAGI